jgi:hypothetical protein
VQYIGTRTNSTIYIKEKKEKEMKEGMDQLTTFYCYWKKTMENWVGTKF